MSETIGTGKSESREYIAYICCRQFSLDQEIRTKLQS